MSWGCNFYGVNTMPNLFLWNSLYPYNYSTSYGGGVQFNTLPMTYSPAEAFAMHNATNPLYNVNQMFNNFAQMLNSSQNQQNLLIQQSAYAFGQNIGSNIGLNNRFNYLASDITNLDSSIDCALNSDKVNEQQKEKLKELKQKLERLKNNLNNVANLRNQGATIEQVKASLDCIRNDFNGIKAEVEAFADASEVAGYAADAVANMKAIGLIQGYNNNYNPKDNLTRAEAATVISTLLELLAK